MKRLLLLITLLLLSGCAVTQKAGVEFKPEKAESKMQKEFDLIPPPNGRRVTVAVYSFQDKTGQRKFMENFASFSTAVTQGAEGYVIKALQDAGSGRWFKVVERVGLDNVVKERQLIRSQRELYEGKDAKTIDPLLVAGVVIEGGIVGFDTSIITGGIGARYLGIGLDKQYEVDQVTAVIRLVSISTGEVLLSVGASKTIFSVKSDANVMTFVDSGTKALELEAGNGANEPTTYAVRMAVEAAVVDMVREGEKKKLWRYKKGK